MTCPEGHSHEGSKRLSVLRKWAHRPVSAESTVVFRMAFGLVMAFWCFDYLRTGRVSLLCSPDLFHFSYPGFDWVQPWPGHGMNLQFIAMMVSALCIAAGAMYRVATVVFALGFTHFFLIDRTNYQNHYYLVMLLSWVMVVVPVHLWWSVDVLSKSVPATSLIPRWCLALLQFHIALPYVFGGVAKLDADWLASEPMRHLLLTQQWPQQISSVVSVEVLARILTWGGLLFDLLIVPAVCWKRTRIPAFVAALLFHLSNSMLFTIHIFPWLMMAATTVFFAPNWPTRLLNQLRRKTNPSHDAMVEQESSFGPRLSSFGLSCVLVYGAFQLLWPFRHLLHNGHTGWTEQGHYFSWRMMLRGKTTGLQYYLVDKQTLRIWNADVRQFLNHEQELKFSKDPAMIADFARFLSRKYFEQSGHHAAVHVLALASLNGRKPQLLVDPQIDLSLAPRWEWNRSWIMPLTEPLTTEPWQVPIDEWQNHVKMPPLPFLLTASVHDDSHAGAMTLILN
jgi:vitamin K-dependent gamma-carboxylase